MNVPVLKMQGRSGCPLEVHTEGENAFVKKYSSSTAYNTRLIKQARKQKDFSPAVDFMKAPAVLQWQEANGAEIAWFDMEYIHAEKYSDFLERISVKEIQQLCQKLSNYFNRELEKAIPSAPDTDAFKHKLGELKDKLSQSALYSQDLLQRIFAYAEQVPAANIPLKTCHGDFTFSNMLFYEQDIYLLDFLDSFIESPLIDLVKLRQDTCFKWSLMIENELPQHRINKITQIFDHIDRYIQNSFAAHADYQHWYKYLQTFNLLRILPYLQQPQEIQFVENCLTQLHT